MNKVCIMESVATDLTEDNKSQLAGQVDMFDVNTL